MASDGYRRGYVSFAHFLLYFLHKTGPILLLHFGLIEGCPYNHLNEPKYFPYCDPQTLIHVRLLPSCMRMGKAM